MRAFRLFLNVSWLLQFVQYGKCCIAGWPRIKLVERCRWLRRHAEKSRTSGGGVWFQWLLQSASQTYVMLALHWPSVKYYAIRGVTYAEGSCHATWTPFCSTFSAVVGLASNAIFDRSFILSEQVFNFMAAFGIAWFNNSTLFIWSWTRDQRIRNLFRVAKLYKTWSAETACSAT